MRRCCYSVLVVDFDSAAHLIARLLILTEVFVASGRLTLHSHNKHREYLSLED